jgi:DNA-binding transcriptional LysR family regulator
MNNDLNDVLVFTHVADLGSFTAAAQRLSMPKSSVSARVARLEARLGARLIERSTRRLRLTAVGARYHEHAKRVILELDQAAATVDRFRSRPSGELRVSASIVFGQALLRPVVTEYVRRHPQVQVFVDLSNRRVDLLEEGFDLALRAGDLADSGLVARRLGQAGARLYASPAYLKQRGTPRVPGDLSSHELLEGASQASASSWSLRRDHDGRVERVETRFRLISNDPPTLASAALAGVGIASLPTFFAAGDVRAGRLVVVLPAWSTRQLDIHAVFPSHKSLSPALRAFVDLTATLLDPQLASDPHAVRREREAARQRSKARAVPKHGR